mmetsp:Transcript_13455/g.32630  ORF Transcript_13455/g.32630 Transcript_13455/m.32630 type:complete len:234 (+) Transcript_13455:270-971(+)
MIGFVPFGLLPVGSVVVFSLRLPLCWLLLCLGNVCLTCLWVFRSTKTVRHGTTTIFLISPFGTTASGTIVFVVIIFFFQQRYAGLPLLLLLVVVTRTACPPQLQLQPSFGRLPIPDLAGPALHIAARPIQRPRRLRPHGLPPLRRSPFLPPIRLRLPFQRLPPRQQFWIPFDVRDVPSPFRLLHNAQPLLAQISNEVAKSRPLGGVHVHVVLILNDLLVNIVRVHALRAVPPS